MLYWQGAAGDARAVSVPEVDAAAQRLARFFASVGARRVGVHLTPVPELVVTVLAVRRAGLELTGLGEGPDVIVTADGGFIDGTLRALKDEVDAASPGARTVVVVRRIGDAPLAPTLDAYLDTRMIDGRDVWFHDVCALSYDALGVDDVLAAIDSGVPCLLREVDYVGASG